MSPGPRRLVAGMLVLTAVLVVTGALVPVDELWFAPVRFAPMFAAFPFQLASLVGQHRNGPARFVVQRAAFAVPTNWAFAFQLASGLLYIPFLSGMMVGYWKFPGQVHPFRPVVTGLAVLASAVVVLMATLLIPQVVAVLRGRPILALTPDGLRVRMPLADRRFPWEALLAWSPAGGYDLRSVLMPVYRPELVSRRGPLSGSSRLALGFADVHPWFFADAVRFYVLHPERRAGIGTAEEHERLLADLGVRALVTA